MTEILPIGKGVGMESRANCRCVQEELKFKSSVACLNRGKVSSLN